MKKMNTKEYGVVLVPTTKKETKILNNFKYNCFNLEYGAHVDSELLPFDNAVNSYIWPDFAYEDGGFDYDGALLRIPSNLDVLNAYYTVRNPIRAAKWRKRHGVKVTTYKDGDENWGYTIYHFPSFQINQK